jgi:hypothetical protein
MVSSHIFGITLATIFGLCYRLGTCLASETPELNVKCLQPKSMYLVRRLRTRSAISSETLQYLATGHKSHSVRRFQGSQRFSFLFHRQDAYSVALVIVLSVTFQLVPSAS